MSYPIRIAIADDHAIFRHGIIAIATKYGFDVVAEACNGAALLEALADLAQLPDVCILDINMPVMNGYQTIAALKSRWPSIRVLALSMYDAEFPVIKMLGAGASGYLLKDCAPQELKAAILAVVTNGYYYSEIGDNNYLPAGTHKIIPRITEKEMAFLSWCCCDLGYKEIAARMNISTRTAESYADILCGKLGVKSRIGLVLVAMQIGVKPVTQ